jgi:AcrR family transcriptional regulator
MVEANAGYARSTRSERGEARRLELLDQVTADLAASGLVGFSLRRAARAAGTTHKVLLYHFADLDDLLHQCVDRLREQRIDRGLAATGRPGRSLAKQVPVLWRTLVGEDTRVLDQVIGLSMYDPARYAPLAREATAQYLPVLIALCPPQWTARRKREMAEMILGTLRGFLVEWSISGAPAVAAGLRALVRAVEREEAASD